MPKKTIIWVGGWSDNTEDVRDLVRSLRSAGVKTQACNTSPYVGHRELRVAKDDLKLAVKVLREFGEDFIAESMKIEYP